jgi:excisionase family DNA binding protein
MATARRRATGEQVQGSESAASASREFLSTQALAARLNVPIGTLYSWRYKGTGPKAYRIGKHLRYRWEDVMAWLETQDDPYAR